MVLEGSGGAGQAKEDFDERWLYFGPDGAQTQTPDSSETIDPYSDPDLLEAFEQFHALPEHERNAALSRFNKLVDDRYPHDKYPYLQRHEIFSGLLGKRKSS